MIHKQHKPANPHFGKSYWYFIVKIQTGSGFTVSLVLAGVARTDQETSAPLGGNSTGLYGGEPFL